jgi:hypothetical protein
LFRIARDSSFFSEVREAGIDPNSLTYKGRYMRSCIKLEVLGEVGVAAGKVEGLKLAVVMAVIGSS